MRKKIKYLILFFTLVNIFTGQVQSVSAKDAEKPVINSDGQPSFESYPAKFVESKNRLKLVLTTRLAKKYKTIITTESAKPVNFAGHYRLATWGCGTDCRGFAIINKQTGRVYTLPGLEDIAGVMGNEEDRLAFRADSRLFVITGIINDTAEGKFFYVWQKEKLHLLAKRPIVKHDIFTSEVH